MFFPIFLVDGGVGFLPSSFFFFLGSGGVFLEEFLLLVLFMYLFIYFLIESKLLY